MVDRKEKAGASPQQKHAHTRERDQNQKLLSLSNGFPSFVFIRSELFMIDRAHYAILHAFQAAPSLFGVRTPDTHVSAEQNNQLIRI